MSSTEQEVPIVPNSSVTPQRLGREVLTLFDCVAQSLSIGPIFSTAFVAFLIAGIAAGAAPVAVIIGIVGVLALGRSDSHPVLTPSLLRRIAPPV